MDNHILRQTADIGNSMTTMRDNLRALQDDMTRRFNSLALSIGRRLDALEADISNTRFGSLSQHVTELQETIEQRFSALDADLDQRFTHLAQSMSTRQQSERMTQLLQDLGRQTTCHRQEIETLMHERVDTLGNHFDTTISRLETRLNTRSDILTNHFDTAIDQLEIRLSTRLDNLRVRIDTSHTTIRQLEERCTAVHQRLVTLNGNVQDLLVRIQELKLEVRAG